MPHGAPMRFAQRAAQRPGLMGFSPSLWLRFVARRFGIENPRRRDAGNEYNHCLSRMVKLRGRQRRICTAIHVGLRSTSERQDKQCHHHEVEGA
jgi:hypothetical protein